MTACQSLVCAMSDDDGVSEPRMCDGDDERPTCSASSGLEKMQYDMQEVYAIQVAEDKYLAQRQSEDVYQCENMACKVIAGEDDVIRRVHRDEPSRDFNGISEKDFSEPGHFEIQGI